MPAERIREGPWAVVSGVSAFLALLVALLVAQENAHRWPFHAAVAGAAPQARPTPTRTTTIRRIPSDQVAAVALSGDGRLLALASKDRQVSVWNTSTGEQSNYLLQSAGDVEALALSPKGTFLAVVARLAGEAATTTVWSLTGVRTSWKVPILGVTDLSWAPSAETLALCGNGSSVVDASTHQVLLNDPNPSPPSPGSTYTGMGYCGSLGFSPDGSVLAIRDEVRGLRFWRRMRQGTFLRFAPAGAAGSRTGLFTSNSWILGPSGNTIMDCEPGQVQVSETATGLVQDDYRPESESFLAAAFSRDGKRAVVLDTRGQVTLRDLLGHRNLRLPWGNSVGPGPRMDGASAVFTQDGGTVVIVSDTQVQVRVFAEPW